MADRPTRGRPLTSLPRRPQPHVTRRAPVTGRYRSPSPPSVRRAPGETGGLPWAARVFLVIAIVALGGSVLLVASGMLGRAVAGFGNAVNDLFGSVTGPAATASPVTAPTPDAPHLVQPTDAYTNRPEWDVSGFAPNSVVGLAGYRVRIYVAGNLAAEQPLGPTQDFTVPAVTIPLGRSSITATIVGPSGESAQSAPISVVFDNVPPALAITAPKDGDVVNGGKVTITGKTQTGSTLVIHDDNTKRTTTGVATVGTFSVDVPLGTGTNNLTITSTDPAGNVTTKKLTVIGGSAQTSVRLRLSNSRIALTALPKAITMTATLLDQNGAPIAGATAAFGLSLPGLPTASFDATTDQNGQAAWTTTIPKDGVTTGIALVTVVVTLPDGKQLTQTASFALL